MPRPPKGSHRIVNGRVYFRFRGDEWAVGSIEDWPVKHIEAALQKIVNEYLAGTWAGPPKAPINARNGNRGPSFPDLVTDFLAEKNRQNKRRSTIEDLERRCGHLLTYFEHHHAHDIDREAIKGYQAYKREERTVLLSLKERYKTGDKTLTEDQLALAKQANRVGLSAAGINRTIVTLGAIIEMYRIKHGPALMPINPAYDKTLKINEEDNEEKSFLEPDHVAALFEGAQLLEAEARADRQVLGRFEMCAVLVCTGIRIHEMCNLRRRDVNLEQRYLNVNWSKTKAGVRPVYFSPWLADVLRRWMFDRQTEYTSADDYLFPTTRGKRRDEDRFRDRILSNAMQRGDDLLYQARKSPMPSAITPHALRRTYITYAADLALPMRFVMLQVGHKDPGLTVGVYEQSLVQRNDERLATWIGDRFSLSLRA